MCSQRVEVGRESVLTRNSSVISTDLDGEIVLLNVESGKYLGIKGVGSSIWEMLETPKTFDDILSLLMAEYDVSREVCEEKTSKFLDELVAAGLVAAS